jgi:hypothetical protein
MPERTIELEPGVYLSPDRGYVVFVKEGISWPLPGLSGAPDSVIAAYERMIWDDRETRQRVIRCLRKGLAVMRKIEAVRNFEPGTICTYDALVLAGWVKP